jgi:glutathione S-transferase
MGKTGSTLHNGPQAEPIPHENSMNTTALPNASALILHQYKESPYAEKARVLMGYKGLRWHAVNVPRIAPKPDMTALTGGYRKVPVLQVGADVYCDTRMIAQVIDAHQPLPSLQTAPGSLGPLLENWVDHTLFLKAVDYTFGQIADVVPDALLTDRGALRGVPLEREALKAAVPLAAQTLRTLMPWLAQALADGRSFFNGATPDVGDFTLYSTLWFARVGRFDFSAWPALGAWLARMDAFGHGEPLPLDAEQALDVARLATPVALQVSVLPDGSGLQLGQQVAITPESAGHGTTVTGELVALNPERLTVRHQHARCGTVHIHFPRLGYRMRAA